MGRAGRRRAEERFDVRRMVAQYEALYLEGEPAAIGVSTPAEGGEHDARAGRILNR